MKLYAERLSVTEQYLYNVQGVDITVWNADIYDRFGKERLQPSIDLIDRISDKKFNRILDVGCGTGMSTSALTANWSSAEIIGVDLSEEMLQKARENLTNVTFFQRDCSKPLLDMGAFDLIFSNAFLQWIPNQEEFISNSFDMLVKGGVFAAQIPLFDEMPASRCITNAVNALSDHFTGAAKPVSGSPSEYYEIISKYTQKVMIWVTDYYHEMDGQEKILDFLKGTALHPYMDKLDGAKQNEFLSEVLNNLKCSYPCQQNGKVLFPFKRLFLLGEK